MIYIITPLIIYSCIAFTNRC